MIYETHKTFIQDTIGHCLKDSVQMVVDLNNSLQDPKLAIRMVMTFYFLICIIYKTIINLFVYSFHIGYCTEPSMQISKID